MRYPWMLVIGISLVIGCEKKKEDCATSESGAALIGDEAEGCPAPAPATESTISSPQPSPSHATNEDPETVDEEPEVLAITSVSPTYGPTSGGTEITIIGASFSDETKVDIGGKACLQVTLVSETSITCVTPAASKSAVDVTVTKGDESAALTSVFNFLNPAAVSADYNNLAFSKAPTSYVSYSGTITFTNSGDLPATGVQGNDLNVFDYVSTGTFPGYYYDASQSCGATLAAGSSCKVNIKFAPSSPGLKQETFIYSYHNGVSQQTISIPLSGTGATPGSFYEDFGVSGTIVSANGNDNHKIMDMAFDDNSNLLAVGTHINNGDSEIVVRRYDWTGTLDNTFATGGTLALIPAAPCTNAVASKVKPLSSGKYLVAFECWDDSFVYKLGVVRLTSAGAVDTTYGASGYFMDDAGVSTARFVDASFHDDGSVHLFGSYIGGSYHLVAMAVSASGILDPTQYTSGIADVTIGTAAKPNAAIMDSSKNIYVAGDEWISAGVYDAMIVKIKADGSGLETAFGNNGKKVVDLGASNDRAISLYMTWNNYLVVGVRTGKNLGVLAMASGSGAYAVGFGTNGIVTLDLGLADGYEVFPTHIDMKYSSIVERVYG